MTHKNTQSDKWQLDKRERDRITELAWRDGVSPQEVIRRALDNYSSHAKRSPQEASGKESLFDRGQRLGLLGQLDDTPPDLSTNEEHFKEFGL